MTIGRMTNNDAVIVKHIAHLRRGGATPATIRHRRDNLKRLARQLDKPLLEASGEDLNDWQDMLYRRVDVVSVHVYTSHTRAFFRWAYEDAELLEENPARRLALPKLRKRQSQPIPEGELAFALSAAAPDPHMFAWLCLAGYCGLRAGEIAQVGRDDFSEDKNGHWLLVHGKGGKDRKVPVPEEVMAHLRQFMHQRGALFRRPTTGHPVTANEVSHRTSVFLHELGIDRTLHKLRHRFATALKDLGLDPRAIQELLGHESLLTTTIYINNDVAKSAPFVAELGHGLAAA